MLAWAEILPGLPPATRAAAAEAQPIGIDRGVITFGVPERAQRAAEPRFRKEADAIRAALSERLGGTVKFKLVPHAGFDAEPARGRTAPVAASESEPLRGEPPVDDAPDDPVSDPPSVDAPSDLRVDDAPDEMLDLSELVDADAPGVAVDSVSKFTQSFDATFVEEVPRD